MYSVGDKVYYIGNKLSYYEHNKLYEITEVVSTDVSVYYRLDDIGILTNSNKVSSLHEIRYHKLNKVRKRMKTNFLNKISKYMNFYKI